MIREDVKTYIGVAGDAFDDVIDQLIVGAIGTLKTLCNRTFNTTTTDPHTGAVTIIENDFGDDIKLVLLEMVSEEFRRRKSQGIDSEGIGAARIDWSTVMTERHKRVIAANRYYNV